MQEAAHPSLHPEDADLYSQYLLHSQTEIIFVLRETMQRGCMITAYFDAGDAFFLTSVLDVTPQGVVLDYGGDELINERAILTRRLVCLTSVDRVKVQFVLHGVDKITFENRPAFFSALPDTVLRLQRREFFRVGTPIANPVKCEIPIDNADGSGTILQVPLVDISAGGLGITATPEQVVFFEPGRILDGCLLALQNEAQITMSLVVRNAFEVTTRSGSHYIRVGCEYRDLRPASLNIIQRYITRLERERKARLAGPV